MTILFFLILIVLAALIGDHYSRLQRMGWAPQVEEYKRGRSFMDPVGSAFGELGRADGAFRLIASVVDMFGTVTGLVYAPIGAALSGVGKALELVFKPIGAVLGAITGFGLRR